jgi:hypothetical protein
MMITDKMVEQALRYLTDPQQEGSKARAAAEHMDDLTKTVLSKLMMQSEASSAAAKEMEARAHPNFTAHLDQVKLCREVDYMWRNRLSASNAIIEMWRTEQSNIRAAEKVR